MNNSLPKAIFIQGDSTDEWWSPANNVEEGFLRHFNEQGIPQKWGGPNQPIPSGGKYTVNGREYKVYFRRFDPPGAYTGQGYHPLWQMFRRRTDVPHARERRVIVISLPGHGGQASGTNFEAENVIVQE